MSNYIYPPVESGGLPETPLSIADGGTGSTTVAGAPWLPLAGGTMSGIIAMGGNNITGGGTIAAKGSMVGSLPVDGSVKLGTYGTGSGSLWLSENNSHKGFIFQNDADTSTLKLYSSDGASFFPVLQVPYSTNAVTFSNGITAPSGTFASGANSITVTPANVDSFGPGIDIAQNGGHFYIATQQYVSYLHPAGGSLRVSGEIQTDGNDVEAGHYSPGNLICSGAIKNNCTVTTVSGSVSGTLKWSQPEQGTGYKKVIVTAQSFNTAGTTTITFPTAFANTPAYVICTGSTVAVTSVSTTQIVIPISAGTSGVVVVEGI